MVTLNTMRKTLMGVHIVLLSLLAIYAVEQVVRWGVKIVNPVNESVRFWNPGLGMIVVAVSLVLLVGILACSTGIIRNPSWLLLGSLQGLWLGCLTWLGWSSGGPFTFQELVGVDLSDASAVSRAQTVHLLQALGVYVMIVAISSTPLLMRWLGGRGAADRSNPSDDEPKPAFQHH